MRSAVIMAALALATRTAEARDPVSSCLGPNGLFTFTLLGGPLTVHANGEDRAGMIAGGRMATCFVERRTRWATLMGWDANVEGGYVSHEADGRPPEEAKSGGHFDLSFGANASPYYRVQGKGKWTLVMSRRLSLRVGFGLNLDYGYAYGGVAYSGLLADSVGIDIGYVYIPAGLSWSGSEFDVTEHRPTVSMTFSVADTFAIGVGAEIRIGSHKSPMDMAPMDQTVVGDYRAVLFTLAFRMQERAK
jgi:hypothetical protein